MKKKAIQLVVCCLISINVFGTAQIPDILIYQGDTLQLFACPLSSFPNQAFINPKGLFGGSGCFFTACRRNYIATWEIIDNKLYLNGIRNACYPTPLKGVGASYKAGVEKDSIGSEFADLKALFPQRYKDGKVQADWVDAKLISPQGELLFYIHSGFESIYETELEFTIVKGVLVGVQELDNSKTKKSAYTQNSKLLTDFIYKQIKRENLPESDSVKRRVTVMVLTTDENGKIDSLRVLRGVNELYDAEAIRVVQSIPEWDVLYRHGQRFYQAWTIPVVFDLTGNE